MNMFKRILVANRGEIAVRIIQTCRSLGIHTIALYEPSDQSSLHVRLADECAQLAAPSDFMNADLLLDIAHDRRADALHPGYGFLAEDPEFARACEQADITFIGPPAAVTARIRGKLEALEAVRAAGIPTVQTSERAFDEGEVAMIRQAADALGYPLVIKSRRGGRGPGERLVRSPDQLLDAVTRSQREAQSVYGDQGVFLEKAIIPTHQVGVQIMADRAGNLIHLGEREGSVLRGNVKLIEETPAPCLIPEGRQALWAAALKIGQLFQYENIGTVEFVIDDAGRFFFSEIKARVQVEHPLTEMAARVDLIREQIHVAASGTLRLRQDDIHLGGHALLARIRAEDPWNRSLAAPGQLRHVRLPAGPEMRVDTYVHSGCDVPPGYSSLIAKLTVWGEDRPSAIARLRRALEEIVLSGTPTNLALIQRVLHAPEFLEGHYSTGLRVQGIEPEPESDTYFRDLAAAAAILYLRRTQSFEPSLPERLRRGWHQDSRHLP